LIPLLPWLAACRAGPYVPRYPPRDNAGPKEGEQLLAFLAGRQGADGTNHPESPREGIPTLTGESARDLFEYRSPWPGRLPGSPPRLALMEQLLTVWAGGRGALVSSGAVLAGGCRFGDIGPRCEAYFGGRR
jgi:hypothetical protein